MLQDADGLIRLTDEDDDDDRMVARCINKASILTDGGEYRWEK